MAACPPALPNGRLPVPLAIKFPAEEGADDSWSGVVFPAEVGGARVECRVATTTLMAVYAVRRGRMLAGFRDHRPEMEAVAERLILAGKVREGTLRIGLEDARLG